MGGDQAVIPGDELGGDPERQDLAERILDAGLEVVCSGSVHDNGSGLNGWFLGKDVMGFYTNAHSVINLGREDHKSNFVEPLDECGVRSYRDLATPSAFQGIDIPSDRAKLMLASFTPQDDSPLRDRAKLRLLQPITGVNPLPLPDLRKLHLVPGQEVMMVSLKPPHMNEPEIEACHIKLIGPEILGTGTLFTDCDTAHGNSAGLYFVRDPADHTQLVAIALHEGCNDRLGDNKDWDLENNTALGIMLGYGFFTFNNDVYATALNEYGRVDAE